MVDLSKAILLSNSVPKTASTLMFEMQSEIIRNCHGGKSNLEVLDATGLRHGAGWVGADDILSSLDFLRKSPAFAGPVVLKVHTAMRSRLADAILADPDVYVSLNIRDPLDIFFSGRENYQATGEFPEFADVLKGCDVISTFFRSIYTTTIDLNRSLLAKGDTDRIVKIARYEDIVADPFGAAFKVLPDRFRAGMTGKFSENIAFNVAQERSAHRLQRGQLKRDLSGEDPELVHVVKQQLTDVRRAFGYL